MKEVVVKSKLSNSERETLVRFDYVDKKWYADTTIPKHYNRLLRQGWKLTEKRVYEDGVLVGGMFEAPERAITIRNAEKKKMSTKQMNNLGNE